MTEEEQQEERPLLYVRYCSHGKYNDGGYFTVGEGDPFSFPACGRPHYATRDKYEIYEGWIEEQKQLKIMQARAAKARAARFGEDAA